MFCVNANCHLFSSPRSLSSLLRFPLSLPPSLFSDAPFQSRPCPPHTHSAVAALHPPFPLSAHCILPIAVIIFPLNCPCSPAPSQCPIASTLNTPPPPLPPMGSFFTFFSLVASSCLFIFINHSQLPANTLPSFSTIFNSRLCLGDKKIK